MSKATGTTRKTLPLAVLAILARRRGVDAETVQRQQEPWRPRWRLLRRTFEKLEAHPVRSIALLRLVLWLAPPLTYALAATRVRLRDHVFGCAIGLLLPVLAADFVGGRRRTRP
jgi:hypothetical protein